MHDPALNGLGTSGQRTGRSPGSRKCNCCPFGYHLDLDFVRYCEKVANSQLLQSARHTLPRLRHSKKKRESIESLLGLLPPAQKQVEKEKRYTVKEAGTIFSDDLEKAVSDFENIFNSSTRTQCSDDPQDHSGELEIEMLRLQNDMFKTPEKNIFHSQFEPLVDSKQNGLSNANPIILQDIRYQMAASLNKLRRLEEEVKVIANLELQVNTLRLENDRLKKCIEYNTADCQKRLKEQRKDYEKKEVPTVHTRTIGTGCKVLHRDVGVSNHVVHITEGTDPIPSLPLRLIDQQTNTEIIPEPLRNGKSLKKDLFACHVGIQVGRRSVKCVKLIQTDAWPVNVPTCDSSVQSDRLPVCVSIGCQFDSPLAKSVDCDLNKSQLKKVAKLSVSTQFDGLPKQTTNRKDFGAQIRPSLSDKEVSTKCISTDNSTQTISILKKSFSCNVNIQIPNKPKIGFNAEPDNKSYPVVVSKFTDTNDICKTTEIGVNTIKSNMVHVTVDTEELKENSKLVESVRHDTNRISSAKDNRFSAVATSFQQLKINENLASSEELREKTPTATSVTSKPYEKKEPSKEMKGAMKVLNDSLLKSPSGEMPKNMRNAVNIVQQEWFRVSSTAIANPLEVEDYLDCFEELSVGLLEYIVNMTDVSGNTAMHYAVSNGNFDVVSILLDSKVCNINKLNTAGYTCIMLVALTKVKSETDKQVVKRLFHMADVNIRARQHGQTALMLAVSHGRIETVELLLESGADINIQDEDGSTALMCAAEHGYIDIVKLLLAQPDCDLSITDLDCNTALNIAMEAGNRDIGVLLYAQEHFSRGSSPYSTLKHRRGKSSTPTLKNRTPTPPTCSQEYSL